MTEPEYRGMGRELYAGRLEVWTSATLATGKPYDSASGETLFDESLRPLVERLERFASANAVERFIVVLNRVTVFTDRPDKVDFALQRILQEFLGWSYCDVVPRVDRRGELVRA